MCCSSSDNPESERIELLKFEVYFLTVATSNCVLREVLTEIWELSIWLLSGLLGIFFYIYFNNIGVKHALELQSVLKLLLSYSDQGMALKKVTIENLSSVKSSLLDLVLIFVFLCIYIDSHFKACFNCS